MRWVFEDVESLLTLCISSVEFGYINRLFSSQLLPACLFGIRRLKTG